MFTKMNGTNCAWQNQWTKHVKNFSLLRTIISHTYPPKTQSAGATQKREWSQAQPWQVRRFLRIFWNTHDQWQESFSLRALTMDDTVLCSFLGLTNYVWASYVLYVHWNLRGIIFSREIEQCFQHIKRKILSNVSTSRCRGWCIWKMTYRSLTPQERLIPLSIGFLRLRSASHS